MIPTLPSAPENILDFPHERRAAPTDALIPTLFHEPWWLDIATRGHYTSVEVSANGRIVGRLPYFTETKLGLFKVSRMPTLTHFLGPAVDEGEGSANTRFLKRLAITRELIAKLPALATIKINCHGGVTDVIPFQEQGFRTAVQFTHEIPPAPEKEIWMNMRDKTRNVIRRAQEKVAIVTLNDPAKFLSFYESNLHARGEESEINRDICVRLIEACMQRNCGVIYAALDDKGGLLAAIFCAWDKKSYFYLMSTRQPQSGNGSLSALVWEGIRDAASRGLIFDLDGLSRKGGILFYTGFGGPPCPRYIVTRSTRPVRMFQEMKSILLGENNFC